MYDDNDDDDDDNDDDNKNDDNDDDYDNLIKVIILIRPMMVHTHSISAVLKGLMLSFTMLLQTIREDNM